MREPITSHIELGQIQIADITFNLKHRDDIPAVLKGLQALYMDEEIRKKVFEILKKRVRPQVDHNRGRPGMDLWRIFVLGVVKQALDCDFDRLQSLACSYLELRQMLGHADVFGGPKYELQTIIDNVSLLTEDVLLEINEVVVRCGHNLLNHQSEDSLQGRVDSAVTKTNVHFPTDVNLLRDSMRCLLRELPRACAQHEVKGWRKSKDWSNKVRQLSKG